MRTISIDSERSAARYGELTSYVTSNLLKPDGAFCCASADACRRSACGKLSLYEGQCSYLGEHYDANDDGQALRILVVPMQTGSDRVGVNLDQRRTQIWNSRDKSFSGPGSRNAHMKGVTKALKVLWGVDPATGREGEWVLPCFRGHF